MLYVLKVLDDSRPDVAFAAPHNVRHKGSVVIPSNLQFGALRPFENQR
jgi:hypothetical protein